MASETKLPIGTVRKSRGLRGELVLALEFTNIEIEKRIKTVWLGDHPDQIQPWEVAYLRLKDNNAFLKLTRVNSRREADHLKGITVYVSGDDLSSGEWFDYIGYRVVTADTDEALGSIMDLEYGPRQQRFVIQTAKGQIQLPIVDEFVKSIDSRNRIVRIEIIDGMMPA